MLFKLYNLVMVGKYIACRHANTINLRGYHDACADCGVDLGRAI